MANNIIGTLATLVLLPATHSTALLINSNTTVKPTCAEVNLEIAALTGWDMSNKISCTFVFGGGNAAPWAAKFKTVKHFNAFSKHRLDLGLSYPIVIKKNNLVGNSGCSVVPQAEQFANEVQALKDLMQAPNGMDDRYPHYVSDFKTADAGYVAMETATGQLCCGGDSLEQMPEKTRREVVRSFSWALEAMWNQGWSHGDHNGQNLMAYKDPKKDRFWVKLLDFGLASKACTDPDGFKASMKTDLEIAWIWASRGLITADQWNAFDQELEKQDFTVLSTEQARDWCLESIRELRKLIPLTLK